MSSLAILVSWEILEERYTRMLRNHFMTSTILFTKIKDEAALWCLEGAKGNAMRFFLWFLLSWLWPNLVCKTSNSE
jgi:hypothetical protein